MVVARKPLTPKYPKSDWNLPMISEITRRRGSFDRKAQALRFAACAVATGVFTSYFRLGIREEDVRGLSQNGTLLASKKRGRRVLTFTDRMGHRLVEINVTTGVVRLLLEPQALQEAVAIVAALVIASLLSTNRSFTVVFHGYRYMANDGHVAIQSKPSVSP